MAIMRFQKKKKRFFFMFMGFSAEETLLAHSVGKDVTIIWDPPKTCSFPKKKKWSTWTEKEGEREYLFFLNVTIFFCVCVSEFFLLLFFVPFFPPFIQKPRFWIT